MLLALSAYRWYVVVQNTFQSFSLGFIVVFIVHRELRERRRKQ